LDEFDVLRRGGRWTALSPIEARIVQLLLANFGGVVPRRDLDAIWANGMPGRSLDVRLTKLRERIAGLGLHIHTVRNQGLLLEVADFAGF
jgi:DNA-binding response OmpR family regulator